MFGQKRVRRDAAVILSVIDRIKTNYLGLTVDDFVAAIRRDFSQDEGLHVEGNTARVVFDELPALLFIISNAPLDREESPISVTGLSRNQYCCFHLVYLRNGHLAASAEDSPFERATSDAKKLRNHFVRSYEASDLDTFLRSGTNRGGLDGMVRRAFGRLGL